MDREARHRVVDSESSQDLDGEKGEERVSRKGKRKEGVSRREKKVKKDEMNVEDVVETSRALRKRMRDILEKDNRSNREGRPAVEKMRHVDDVCNMLISRVYQECLLDEGILGEVKGWLEPLPDRSMPNVKVRKRLLDALKNMRIHKEHLISSGVGKIVYFYSINYKETKEIRNMAKQLVQKWTTEAFRPDEEY